MKKILKIIINIFLLGLYICIVIISDSKFNIVVGSISIGVWICNLIFDVAEFLVRHNDAANEEMENM